MPKELPEIEPGLLYTTSTLPDGCRYLFTTRQFLQYGLPTYYLSTRGQWITPLMGRIYITDYVLLPWEDRLVERHTVQDELRKRYTDYDPSTSPAPNVQQLVLAEVFADEAFDEPPNPVLEGYVFLFWSEIFPDIPAHYTAPLQAWINENEVCGRISEQLTEYRNRQQLLRERSSKAVSHAPDEDAGATDDIEF